ncbi:oligoribonuclease [Spartinivicinus poritis]|uniref:Oligoribonuclease n=1 Tax=Spartinivicinus poritis TaxID=2994640 RepID=A0ABT5U801_9GAMM|nr:oligoribonuclease [Spartinivicinus sp. A2-2]MDE1461279.1 oligoribonuclease [Spartinivicinus sp. A2-2]
MSKAENLIWIDLEMTGLDPEQHRIIEIATIVTDRDLEVIAEGPVFAVHQPEEHMLAMDEWCTTTHGQTGLTERVKNSNIDEAHAEKLTIEFLQQYVDAGVSPMCGNTIGQDRRFLVRYMPKLEKFFHYRSIDVSTLKELAQRWTPEILKHINKKNSHLALEDIRESIEELRYYREHFIRLDAKSKEHS